MARRTKLTEERQFRICEEIRDGQYAQVAAQLAGIGETTFWQWMKRGEREADDPDSIYAGFRKAVKEAQAEAEQAMIQVVRRAAFAGTWQAAAWYLERTHTDRYGRFTKVAVEGTEGAPITLAGLAALLDVEEIDPDEDED
jgi:transposase